MLREGDLCYINPLQLHEFTKIRGEKERYAVIKFDIHTINIPKAYISEMYDYFIRRTGEDDFCVIIPEERLDSRYIGELVRRTVTEYLEKQEFYSLAVRADIYSLLIETARIEGKKFTDKNERRTENDFSFYRILEYIDTHSSEPLEVSELDQMCHISHSHFARLFRENYGRSCKEYITYIQLNNAQELLFHIDHDLNYIA